MYHRYPAAPECKETAHICAGGVDVHGSSDNRGRRRLNDDSAAGEDLRYETVGHVVIGSHVEE